MPVDGRRLGHLENLQRHFTSRIPSVSSMNYWKRLSQLQMLSQQRRLERYRIIYVWKVIESLVPNCGILDESKPRLGRMCNVPHLVKNSSSRIKTLRENSFQIHGPKLFNSLPIHVRNLTNCTVEEFKTHLDKVLTMVPDEPNISGCEYTPRACDMYTGKPSNSIIDQIRDVRFQKQRREGT